MNNDYNYVLQRLKEERGRCGLTQQQLCRFIKVPQSSCSRFEAGHRRLSYPELKRVCASGMDIFYVFTGNKAKNIAVFPGLPEAAPEELLCHLSTVFIYANAAKTLNRGHGYSMTSSEASFKASPQASSEASFAKIRKQLEYIHYVSGSTKAYQNIFYCVRNYYGYTQAKMAGLIGMDIKTLRGLEKGRLLPDSEIIWKMYDQFHVSPAFILMDAGSLRNELNYVLGLLGDDGKDVMLRILKNGHDFMQINL